MNDVRGARARVAAALAATVSALAVMVPAAGDGAVAAPQPEVEPEPVPACGTEGPPPDHGPQAARRSGASVTVATYNVLGALATSNESLDARIPLLVDAIAGAGADIVGLQEVEELGSRGFTTARVAAGLAGATGVAWHWCFFAANPAIPGEPDTLVGGGGPESLAIQPLAGEPLGETVFRTGVGLVARYPIVESGAHRLGLRVPEEVAACPDLGCQLQAQFESRASMRGVVETPRGRLQVVSTHLAHTITSESDLTRIVQTDRMLEWINGRPETGRYATILTGDFNAVEGSAVHEAVLADGFVDTFRRASAGDPGFTSSQDVTAATSTVRNRIDYVFARNSQCTSRPRPGGGPVVRVVSSEILGDAASATNDGFLWPSDHYGVATELRLLPATPGTCAGSEGEDR